MLVAALVAARIAFVWPLSDNHIYLLAYWCLAIGLALSGPAPAATLSTSSRWLLGAAFALAVLWKAVLSPDYVDGRFFRVTLLTDERFADASLVFGGLSREQMAVNRKFLEPLPEGAELLEPPAFVEPPRLRAFAAVATWGGLGARSADRAAQPDAGGRDAFRPPGMRRCSRSASPPTRWRRSPVSAGCSRPWASPNAATASDAARRLCRRVRPDPALFRDPWTGVLADWTGR